MVYIMRTVNSSIIVMRWEREIRGMEGIPGGKGGADQVDKLIRIR